jgi:hypothetical protein
MSNALIFDFSLLLCVCNGWFLPTHMKFAISITGLYHHFGVIAVTEARFTKN